MREGMSLTSKTAKEKLVMLLWIVGNCVWCPMVLVLLWHQGDAQTFAQASANSTRLGMVSGLGTLWAVAGAVWWRDFEVVV